MTKNIVTAFICLVFFLVCNTTLCQTSDEHADSLDSKCTNCDLVGSISRAQLETNAAFNTWFSNNYNTYKLNNKTIKALRSLPKENLSFKIIMGTWCSDSQREVPRFAKILDSLKIDKSAIAYFGLDADKVSPKKIEDTYSISHVPTFIVYRNGKELNRIVEMSIRTLEEDLRNILTINDYKDIYAE